MIYLCTALLAQTALVAFLLIDRRAERHESAAERADLLQRIQAPEVAVASHAVKDSRPAPQPAGFDDDAAYWQSKEELAESL